MKKIKYIPFELVDNQLKDQYKGAFENFLNEKQYILGKNVSEFESRWASFCKSKYAVGVGNGYDALFLSLKALDIQKGDEVIVPAHTFAATALAVLNTGAIPVLVDADPDTFNINTSLIGKKINQHTKAIIVVHLYGNPCGMDEVMPICEKYGLFLIEDNAQAHGALYKGRVTGSFGVLSATSFYPIKNLGALGDAGAINTNSEELHDKLKLLRSYGSPDKHEMMLPGVNSRMDELQAAFLNIKLGFLEEWNKEREEINGYYRRELEGISEIKLCHQPDHVQSANHIFPILSESKEELRTFLMKKGIQTLQHYPIPYHLEKTFHPLKHQKGDFPVTEKICVEELSLPIFPGLIKKDIQYVCDHIKEFFNH